MPACNACGSPMVPNETAIVPALGCINERCGRLIPLPGAHAKQREKLDRAALNRAMRAGRRLRAVREGRLAADRHP